MRGHPIVPLLVASALLVLVTVSTHDARADDALGTTYTGTHEAGGILHLTVSPAGDQITAFDVDGIAGGGCSWDTIELANWGTTIPIVDGHFEALNADGDQLSGQLSPTGQAEGTIEVHDRVKGCETPPLRWVASRSD